MLGTIKLEINARIVAKKRYWNRASRRKKIDEWRYAFDLDNKNHVIIIIPDNKPPLMREALITTLQDYQGVRFAEWPEEAQDRMMKLIRHYCANDEKLFNEIVMTVEEASLKADKESCFS